MLIDAILVLEVIHDVTTNSRNFDELLFISITNSTDNKS